MAAAPRRAAQRTARADRRSHTRPCALHRSRWLAPASHRAVTVTVPGIGTPSSTARSRPLCSCRYPRETHG
eukprot:2361713-Prymnesium_polylepis.1